MSYIAPGDYGANTFPDRTQRPTFTVFHPTQGDTPQVMAAQLRTAFQFLRTHGDRRYSSSALMRLLNHADRLDSVTDEQVMERGHPESPFVYVAELPYNYDEDTEVKSGGILGVMVYDQQNGHKVLLAVNTGKRRQGIGKVLWGFMQSISGRSSQCTWVHRGNDVGQHFALSLGLQPWAMNSSGAIMFSMMPVAEESDAVEYVEDYEIDDALDARNRRNRPRRRSRLSDPFDEGVAAAPQPVSPSRTSMGDVIWEQFPVSDRYIRRTSRGRISEASIDYAPRRSVVRDEDRLTHAQYQEARDELVDWARRARDANHARHIREWADGASMTIEQAADTISRIHNASGGVDYVVHYNDSTNEREDQ